MATCVTLFKKFFRVNIEPGCTINQSSLEDEVKIGENTSVSGLKILLLSSPKIVKKNIRRIYELIKKRYIVKENKICSVVSEIRPRQAAQTNTQTHRHHVIFVNSSNTN